MGSDVIPDPVLPASNIGQWKRSILSVYNDRKLIYVEAYRRSSLLEVKPLAVFAQYRAQRIQTRSQLLSGFTTVKFCFKSFYEGLRLVSSNS